MRRQIDILYEDNHIIAVNKPSGLLMQGDKTGDTPLGDYVKDYIKEKYRKPGAVFLGVVHRIDRPVSGVVLFARTSKMLARLNALFKDRQIDKTYWAIVSNAPCPPQAELVHYLKKNPSKNKSYAFLQAKEGARKAILSYTCIYVLQNYFCLEVCPKTGRHHQIRAQLAAHGCPIKGDIKYGAKRTNADGSIALHARQIRFVHPVKKTPMCIVAPAPAQTLWQEVLNV